MVGEVFPLRLCQGFACGSNNAGPDWFGSALLAAFPGDWVTKRGWIPDQVRDDREKVLPESDSVSGFLATRPGWAEERSRKRIKILDVRRRRSRLVSKISVSCEHRKVPEGTQTAGRLFFAYFLLAKQKKVSRSRAIPGIRLQTNIKVPLLWVGLPAGVSKC